MLSLKVHHCHSILISVKYLGYLGYQGNFSLDWTATIPCWRYKNNNMLIQLNLQRWYSLFKVFCCCSPYIYKKYIQLRIYIYIYIYKTYIQRVISVFWIKVIVGMRVVQKDMWFDTRDGIKTALHTSIFDHGNNVYSICISFIWSSLLVFLLLVVKCMRITQK